MDMEALKSVRAQRARELAEVEKRLEDVQSDIEKRRLLKAELAVIDRALGDKEPNLFSDTETLAKPSETLVSAIRRVLASASNPLSAPQISEQLRAEGRVFKGKDKQGTNTVRGILLNYGDNAPEHRRYFRRIKDDKGSVYELIKKE